MTVYQGTDEFSAIYAGTDEVQFIYQGTDLIWTAYLYYTGTDLSASEESDWDTAGVSVSFSRVNGNTEFQLSTGASPATATLDLYTFCTPGNSYNISLNVVSAGASDQVRAGLYSASASSENNISITTAFSNSPFNSSDTGTQTLSSQVVNASNRYLKLNLTAGDQINFNDIRVSNA